MSAPRPQQPLACVASGIDLVRALGIAGIKSAVVASPGEFARYSRHSKAVIDPSSLSSDPKALVRRLLEFARTLESKPVLYYDGDSKLLLISRFRDELSRAFRFAIPDAELVEDLVDKARFAALAARTELPVPRTVIADPSGEDTRHPEVTRFPVIVKQLIRNNRIWDQFATTKALEVSSSAVLRDLMRRLASEGVPVLVQELVPGPESLVVSYHAYIDEAGDVVGEFSGKKIRTYPRLYGYSSALEITWDDEVIQEGREILKRLDFRGGVAKLDFKRHPGTGVLYLLEINPRFNLWHYPAAKAGVNIPEMVFRDLVGTGRRPPSSVRTGATWVHPHADYRAARDAGIPIMRWLRWFARADTKSGFSWDDPLPIPRALLIRGWRKVGSRTARR